MRWFSFLQGQRSRGWVPVSNTDDPDETGMDDLMRMALGHYQDDDDDEEEIAGSGHLREASQLEAPEECEQPVFHRLQASLWSSVLGVTRGSQSSSPATPTPVDPSTQMCSTLPASQDTSLRTDEGLYHQSHRTPDETTEATEQTQDNALPLNVHRRFCCAAWRRLKFPTRRWYFVLLSLVIPLVFIGLNVGLGVYSLVFYKPDQLVIDKSVKSFSIPNHKAYRNFEALMLARKDNSSSGRYRRDSAAAAAPRTSLWGSQDSAGRRLKRDALLAKEDKMLKHTASVLQRLNLKDTSFSRKAPDTAPPSQFSFQQSSAMGGSITSTLNKLLSRSKRSNREIECLFDYQSIARWKMHVIYLAQGDEDLNMFTKERLKTAHEIEQKIMQHPNFNSFCLRDPHMGIYDPAVRGLNGCVPLNSLLTYFYPSVDSKGNVFYDGLGTNIDDIDSALKLAMNHETFYYYVDDKINKTYQKSYLLRSEVLFGAPLAGYSCIADERKDQDKKFKDFVVTYIGLLSKASTDKVQVLYGGNEIFDYEVSTTFWGDVHLAMVSLLAIFVLMLLLSLSLYLTVLGVVVIALSFPMSLFFYRVVFGINALGILNGAAAFVIIGIGVDDVFVFVNIYRQAAHMKDPAARITYTLRTAGLATFFTSFTTAAAFAANLASAIPAVYEFGLFMALVVSSCWLSVFVLMPPMLYLHACLFEPLERMLFSCLSCGARSLSEEGQSGAESSERGPAHSLSLQQYHHQQEVFARGLYPDDGDVAMLDIADDPPSEISHDAMDDDDMLLIDDPYREESSQGRHLLTIGEEWIHHHVQESGCQHNNPGDGNVDDANVGALNSGIIITSTSNHNNMCLGRVIQRCIMFLTNRIVIRGRYFVVGFYAAVLVTSCVLMTRLQPSTHPPQLFRPDTNIQQLLDLKANFSIIDTLHCDRCSGLYKVHGTQAGRTIRHKHAPVTASPRSAPLIPPPPPLPPSRHSSSSISGNTAGDGSHANQSYDQTQSPNDEGDSQYHSNGSGQDSGGGGGSGLSRGLASLSGQAGSNPLKIMGTSLAELLSALQESYSNSKKPHSVEEETSARNVSGGNPEAGGGQKDSGVNDPDDLDLAGHKSDMFIPTSVPRKSAEISPPSSSGYRTQLREGAPQSVDENFDVCANQACGSMKDRPLLESGATVYVVMGIQGLYRQEDDVGHVLDQFKGRALFDPKFAESFSLNNLDHARLEELCRVCHFVSNQTELVRPGSAQCLPSGMHQLHKVLADIPACRDLPGTQSIYHNQAPAHAEGGLDRDGRLLWLAFAFESTTSEGQAYFEAYKQYEKWQGLMSHIKSEILSKDSPLNSIFQTSKFWTKVLMEVVAVHSAIYGLVLSMLICVLAVAIFTGHLVLLLLVVVTILAMICCVVGVFALCGWEMGAVEAVSLSILVGSSVDYLVHIVEGYILAARRIPEHVLHTQPAGELRRSRTSLAVRHIGVAVVCSALTTVIAAVPLTQTSIQPFSKFGAILLLNTTVSVVMTLTLAVALLAMFAPGRYRSSVRSHLIALVVAAVVTGALVLGIYIAATCFGAKVPGPSGEPLFS